MKIRYVHFPLHPETPAEGLELRQLFAGRERQLEIMKARLQEMLTAEGLPWGERTRTYNSRLAQELACWAESQPGGEAIHDALFRAYFVDACNLADLEVLVDIVLDLGLDGEGARRALQERSFRDRVDEDWRLSRQLGIPGVPAYSFGERILVGAQPYEALEELLSESK